MFDNLEEFSKHKENTLLSDYVVKHKSEIILNCVNESLVEVDEIRSSVSEYFQKEAEQLNIKFRNNKNSIDWANISSAVKKYITFTKISQSETNLFVSESNAYSASRESQLDDPFAPESKFISPLILRQNIKEWRSKAKYVEKLHLQDLLYYNIIDFTSLTSDDGTHKVLDTYFDVEKNRYKIDHKPSRQINKSARELLLINVSN
ncbi:hypothetical protein PS15m_000027 [Mucor circinelloides]